jgi:hypothetical protein
MATGAVWQAILRINDRGARATINNVGDAAREMGNQMGGNLMKATSAFGLMKFALDATVDAAKALVMESREIINISRRYDVPIEKIGAMKRMAEGSGSSLGSLSGAYKELEMNINNAIMRPGKGAARTFDKLGISQKELEALGSDTDAAFMLMVSKLREIKDEGERAAAAQDAFGGSSQEVINIVKMSAEEIDTLRASSFQLTEGNTRANAGILTNLETLKENLKPLGQILADIFGVVLGSLTAVIIGLKIVIAFIKDLAGGLVQKVGAGLTFIATSVAYGIELMYMKGKKAMGMLSQDDYDARKLVMDANINAAMKAQAEVDEKEIIDKKKYQDYGKEFGGAVERTAMSAQSLGESVGLQSDKESIQRKIAEMKDRKDRLQKEIDDQNKKRIAAEVLGDRAGAESAQKKIDALIQESVSINEEIREQEEKAKRRGIQGVIAKDEGKTRSYKSNELEDMAEADRLKKQELAFERRRQEAPLEFRDAVELGILTEKRLMAEKELAAITEANNKNKKTSNTDIARQYELQNKLLEAQNKEMAQFKKMSDDAVKTRIMMTEAERDRKNKAIDEVQEREQFAMQKSGTSAVDRQTVTLNNKINELRRAQEEFDEKNQKQLYTPEQREAAKAKIQDKTFAATKELDKLMAMQFNFTASDAAKKGMGGGIVEQKNMIEINKDQLTYLKKIYEATLQANGLSGKPFMYDPLVLRGKSIAK